MAWTDTECEEDGVLRGGWRPLRKKLRVPKECAASDYKASREVWSIRMHGCNGGRKFRVGEARG